MILQLLDDFPIDEIEHFRPLLDDRHSYFQRGAHRRVLDSDHARADHDQLFRDAREAFHFARVDDRLPVERNHRITSRPRPAGDQNLFGRERAFAVFGHDMDRVWVEKPGATLNDSDFVSPELMPDHIHFAFLDYAYALGEVFFTDSFFQRIVAPIECALAEPGHIQDRFSHRLARNGAGVQGHSAN